MKYEILKTFPGSQDGRETEQFTKGEEVELTDYLAGIVVPEGWARPVKTVEVDNKAIVTDGRRDNPIPQPEAQRKTRGRPRK